jgi:hypothetical protein
VRLGVDRLVTNDSLLARIAAERKAKTEDEHLDLDVPSWSGQLVARYRVVKDEDELIKVAGAKAGTEQLLDLLIKSCSELFLRDADGELERIEDDGYPVGYDDRLAVKLSVEFESARELVRHVFNGNMLALAAHAGRVALWMQDTTADVDEGLLGE